MSFETHLIRPHGHLTRACRPHLTENSPLDCFPGVRCSCRGWERRAPKAFPLRGRCPEGADEVNPVSSTTSNLSSAYHFLGMAFTASPSTSWTASAIISETVGWGWMTLERVSTVPPYSITAAISAIMSVARGAMS